jgi:hypothetical protein
MSTRAGLLAVALTAAAVVAVPGSAVATPSGAALGSEFTALSPQRVLDTWDGTGVVTQAGHDLRRAEGQVEQVAGGRGQVLGAARSPAVGP